MVRVSGRGDKVSIVQHRGPPAQLDHSGQDIMLSRFPSVKDGTTVSFWYEAVWQDLNHNHLRV